MRRLLSEAWRLVRGLPLVVLAFVMFAGSALVLAVADLVRMLAQGASTRNGDRKEADRPNKIP